MRIYQFVFFILFSWLLTSCAITQKKLEVENVGDTFSGSIQYDTNKLDADKYKLEAKGVFGVDNSPDIDRVLEGFKARADKLCLPKSAVYHYQIGTWSYNKKAGNMTFSVDAPKVSAIVNCQ